MLDPSQHARFRELVEAHDRFVVTTHMNPDGDAIGSEIGLARFLLRRGADVRVVNQEATPRNLAYLEESGPAIEVFDPGRHETLLRGPVLVVLLDNSAPDRLGRMEPILLDVAEKVLCIDHHPASGTPWRHNILDERECATAAMIFDLVRSLGQEPDLPMAEALYAGLATDTGFFRFNSTRARAHEIAGALLSAGVEPARCYREIYERNSPAWTRLLGEALARLRLDAGGAVVSVTITREMTERCGAIGVDTSEMTTFLLAIEGVRIALLFREGDGGRVKVSLRSKGTLDVYRLASEYGGGGHRNASGIVTSGRLDGIVEEIVARAVGLVSGPGGARDAG